MNRYKLRSTVQAWRWDGSDEGARKLSLIQIDLNPAGVPYVTSGFVWGVNTLLGNTRIRTGEWVVVDQCGNRTICPANVFDALYEPA